MRRFLIAIALVFWLAGQGWAADFYFDWDVGDPNVASAVPDSTEGGISRYGRTTDLNAWTTKGQPLVPGDTIHFQRGDYWGTSWIILPIDGESGNSIYITSYGPKNQLARIDTNSNPSKPAIDSNNKDYWEISNLFLIRGNTCNVIIQAGSQSIMLRHMILQYPLIYNTQVYSDDNITFRNVVLNDGGAAQASIAVGEANSVWENCIFYGDRNDFDVGGEVPACLIYSHTDEAGTGNFTDDPLFVDVETAAQGLNVGDYHILSGSPCRDAGVNRGSGLQDVYGNPVKGTWDVGAHEWPSSGTGLIHFGEGVATDILHIGERF